MVFAILTQNCDPQRTTVPWRFINVSTNHRTIYKNGRRFFVDQSQHLENERPIGELCQGLYRSLKFGDWSTLTTHYLHMVVYKVLKNNLIHSWMYQEMQETSLLNWNSKTVSCISKLQESCGLLTTLSLKSNALMDALKDKTCSFTSR